MSFWKTLRPSLPKSFGNKVGKTEKGKRGKLRERKRTYSLFKLAEVNQISNTPDSFVIVTGMLAHHTKNKHVNAIKFFQSFTQVLWTNPDRS